MKGICVLYNGPEKAGSAVVLVCYGRDKGDDCILLLVTTAASKVGKNAQVEARRKSKLRRVCCLVSTRDQTLYLHSGGISISSIMSYKQAVRHE
jgi:hypothetical protein